MFICAEYLHMPHCEFKKLSHEEQLKWIIWADEDAKSKDRQYKEMKAKSDMAKAKASAPKSPGVTRLPSGM